MKLFLIAFSLLAIFAVSLDSCVTVPGSGSGLASDNWPVKQCGPVDSHPEVTVCYYETGPIDPVEKTDAVLFLHGLGDSARVFVTPSLFPSSYPDLIQAFTQKGIKIVAISWGFSWLITDYPNRKLIPTTATTDVFADVLDKIAAKYNLSGKWHLMGHSMGGANAATVLAKFGISKFLSATLINPMLVTDATNIWDPKIIGNLINGSFFTDPNACDACLVYEPNFPLLDQWTWQNYRPSAMLAKADAATLPPTYVTACPTDNFNLWKGDVEWTKQRQAKGPGTTFEQGATGCDHFHFPVAGVVGSTGLFNLSLSPKKPWWKFW